MNQKDYKEIARIIKEGCFTAEARNVGLCWRETPKTIINHLADYFEREYSKISNILMYGKKVGDKFNKKQFLKDCGVK